MRRARGDGIAVRFVVRLLHWKNSPLKQFAVNGAIPRKSIYLRGVCDKRYRITWQYCVITTSYCQGACAEQFGTHEDRLDVTHVTSSITFSQGPLAGRGVGRAARHSTYEIMHRTALDAPPTSLLVIRSTCVPCRCAFAVASRRGACAISSRPTGRRRFMHVNVVCIRFFE